MTDPKDHASNKITAVMAIFFIPSTHSLMAFSMVIILSNTAIKIATMDASNAAWNNATDALEADNASKIPLNDNGAVFIKVMSAWFSPLKILVYPLQ